MNILLIGKPGSGKGTITQRLTGEGFLQLSTGDLLRMEIDNQTEIGKELVPLLKAGKFATDEVIFGLVKKFLENNSDKSIIFDGFPRNLKQAQHCLENGILFDHVFHIDVPDDIVKERIVNRRVHLNSGRVYNIKTLPPKIEGIDDITGEPLTHRDDDRVEVLDKRLENFKELTLPIVNFLKDKNFNIIQINGLSPISEQVKLVENSLKITDTKKLKI